MTSRRRRLSIANLTDIPIPQRRWRDPLYEAILRQIGQKAMDRSFPAPKDSHPEGSILDVIRARGL